MQESRDFVNIFVNEIPLFALYCLNNSWIVAADLTRSLFLFELSEVLLIKPVPYSLVRFISTCDIWSDIDVIICYLSKLKNQKEETKNLESFNSSKIRSFGDKWYT